MKIDELIFQQIQKLPNVYREELLDYIGYLLMKAERQEEQEWSTLSLTSAMRGMEEEEPLYTLSDLKVVFG